MERGYNARGYLSTLADATTGTKKTLVRYGAMDARGNIETETFGNGAETTRAHDPKTGRPRSIGTSRGTSTFQNHAYAWLTDGSLASRTANAAGSGATARTLGKEEFDYDYLGRLDSAATKLGGATTANRTLDYGYDNRGNLTSKTSDAAGDKNVTSTMYEQGSAGPHALTRATVDGVVHDFRYDAQGHLERDDAASGDDRFIEWDGRGLATRVTVGTAKDAETPAARERFLYGPGGARYLKKSEWKVVAADGTAAMKSETTYYAGGYEKTTRACTVGEGESETESTESVERTRVGPVLHVKRTPCGNSSAAPAEIEYRHFDHLGSSASITDAAGAELVALAHDPHGERRKPDWTRRLSESEIETLAADHGDRTSRGFTGHEHLDRTGLVHMNGRLYDPLLGRFLSPDPIVANPADGQQWNLYSYAGNSPLSYVDPSGLSFCDPAQQSWCGGVGLPSGGWGGGGYSTRTVSGWSAYVTFGVYYEIVRIWQSASVSRWDAGVEGGGSWGSTGDTFWEDVQRSVIYPIVQFFFWSFQVVEQGAAAEPASSADIGFSIFEVDPDTGRIVIRVNGKPGRRYPPEIDPDKDPDYVWRGVPVVIKGKNHQEYEADLYCGGYPGGQTNCHGTSVAGGQVWIQVPVFRRILDDFFQVTKDLKEGNLVVWFDGQQPIHSAIITSVGSGINDSLATGMLGARAHVETMMIDNLNKIYEDDSPAMYEPK